MQSDVTASIADIQRARYSLEAPIALLRSSHEVSAAPGPDERPSASVPLLCLPLAFSSSSILLFLSVDSSRAVCKSNPPSCCRVDWSCSISYRSPGVPTRLRNETIFDHRIKNRPLVPWDSCSQLYVTSSEEHEYMNGAKIRADKDGRLICRRLGPSSEMKEAPTGLRIFARPTLPPLLCRFWSAAL
jgi:hypothetical protein